MNKEIDIVELIGEDKLEEFINEWYEFHMDNLDAPSTEEFLGNNRNVFDTNTDEYRNS